MTDTLTVRERFNRVMRFQPVDRLPIIEWAPFWDQTLIRWEQEGLDIHRPFSIPAFLQIQEDLGLDPFAALYTSVRKPGMPAAASHGAGIVQEHGWTALREWLFPEPEASFDMEWARHLAARQARGELVVWMVFEGFFWFPRTLFGIEDHLMAFYDEPDLMHKMNQALVEWQQRVLEVLCEVVTPDIMTFAEDMSYNHGPMLSRSMYDTFMHPYYRQIVPLLRQRNILVFADSDGDVTHPIEWFKSSGLQGILPLERMAGVDVQKIRADHPEWLMLGAFDKTVMHKGEAAIRAEFERLLPVMRSGGFAPGCDHQTPPGVSLNDYRLYLQLFREYAGFAAQ